MPADAVRARNAAQQLSGTPHLAEFCRQFIAGGHYRRPAAASPQAWLYKESHKLRSQDLRNRRAPPLRVGTTSPHQSIRICSVDAVEVYLRFTRRIRAFFSACTEWHEFAERLSFSKACSDYKCICLLLILIFSTLSNHDSRGGLKLGNK